MKSICISVFLLLLNFAATYAQGIKFDKISFEEATERAKKEGKIVFIDFYTDWCVPCKVLDKEVFSQTLVGDFFNDKFVSIKMDAEKEGKEYAQRFKVAAYPTMTFTNGQGELVNKVVGSIKAEKLLDEAQKSLDMQNDPNSYFNLKKQYETKKNDPVFLQNYIAKMISFSESPRVQIEDFLKNQRHIKEKSADMMEFFLAYYNHMTCGGEAERILNQNYEEYIDIATRKEERTLKSMPDRLIQNTYRVAVANQDPKLFEVFLDRWVKMPEKPYYSDYNAYKLELIALKKEDGLYKKEAVKYLDSLTTHKSIAEIKLKDSIRYADYVKANPVSVGFYAEASRLAQKDLDAGILVRNMNKALEKYVTLITKKGEFKNVEKWAKYGLQLVPTDIALTNFAVEALVRQNKKKEAIQVKEKLIKAMNPKDKGYNDQVVELENLKNS
ncbi:thioredoxin family protein [Sphingobacterium sp. xlx-130]|uniref:thioredoxin family protein n=1 Tax=Sphingobacterium sp. xlx-130 TaxID=2654323 RepID=UPI0013DCE5F6|nr:thioredoxin fold domain-containing protein [Sphingobacterium sp. xlx-130]